MSLVKRKIKRVRNDKILNSNQRLEAAQYQSTDIHRATSALGDRLNDELNTRACEAPMECIHRKATSAAAANLQTNSNLGFEDEAQAEVGSM